VVFILCEADCSDILLVNFEQFKLPIKNTLAFLMIKSIAVATCQMQLAHACSPTYLGGRNQEDRGSKPTQANSS
jgi:hypothetical protein